MSSGSAEEVDLVVSNAILVMLCVIGGGDRCLVVVCVVLCLVFCLLCGAGVVKWKRCLGLVDETVLWVRVCVTVGGDCLMCV